MKMKPLKKRLLIALVITISLLQIVQEHFPSLKLFYNDIIIDQSRRRVLQGSEAPIIYTFFEQGRTMDNDKHVFEEWKEIWSEAGWDARILSLEDAKQHPDYDKYRELFVEKAKVKKNDENIWEGSDSYFCFIRWLAMAVQDTGGWMVEYDIFPMGITVGIGLDLPNDGKFTSFEDDASSLSLLSGTVDEWERVSQLILDRGTEEVSDKVKFSEVSILRDIHLEDEESIIIVKKNSVWNYPNPEIKNEDIDCQILEENENWVVRLPHKYNSLTSGNVTISDKDRKMIHALIFFYYQLSTKWKEECNPNFDLILHGHDLLADDLSEEDAKSKVEIPVIYTFYHQRKIDDTDYAHFGDEALLLFDNEIRQESRLLSYFDDQNLQQNRLSAWKQIWTDAGWEPRVLTIDDAKTHPDYQKYHNLLLKNANKYINIWEYSTDYLCFIRWLAMATHGSGGWLTDYDTFPIGITTLTGLNLPNEGKFTSYEQHVPSLMSGNGEEWNRVTNIVLERALKEKDSNEITIYSDMLALFDLHKEDAESVLFTDDVFHVLMEYPYKVNTEDEKNIIDCGMLSPNDFWVAHLSPYTTSRAVEEKKLHIPDGLREIDTHLFAKELISLWNVKCSNNLGMNAGRESALLDISSDRSLSTKITNDGTEQQQHSLLLNKGYVGIEYGTGLPIIHTFFHKRKQKDGEYSENDVLQQNRLNVWYDLWTKAGWEPRVLTIDDAKTHPDYDDLNSVLLKNANKYTNIWEDSPDHLCFIRWLAMAAHGSGGWLTDYDTFPIGITTLTGLNLPNEGEFTSYEQHVPSLMSGNGEEWNRVTNIVLERALKNKDSSKVIIYSDMLALFDLHKENDESVLFTDDVFHVLMEYPYKVNTEDEKDIIDCEMLNASEFWVAHLSPYTTSRAVEEKKLHIPDGLNIDDIHIYAWLLIMKWKSECGHDL